MNNEHQSDSQTLEMEVLQPSAIEALERAAVDIQIATAHKFPRSMAQFQKRSMEMATLDMETAASCIYRRPIGKDDRGKPKYAEGESIRLAEIVAAAYGNIRVSASIVEQTPRYVKCVGVAHDLESNYAGKSEAFEPTVRRDGSPYGEAQRAVVAKACLAKAYRDAVFKVVPKALCKSVVDAAKKVALGDATTFEGRRKKAKSWVDSLKIQEKAVFSALDIKGWNDLTSDHLEILTGLKTAISEKETTVEDAFPGAYVKTSETPSPPAGAPIDVKSETLIAKPLDHLRDLMKRDGVVEEQVMTVLRLKQYAMAKESQVELLQLTEDKLRAVIKAWPNVVAEMKAVQV